MHAYSFCFDTIGYHHAEFQTVCLKNIQENTNTEVFGMAGKCISTTLNTLPKSGNTDIFTTGILLTLARTLGVGAHAG